MIFNHHLLAGGGHGSIFWNVRSQNHISPKKKKKRNYYRYSQTLCFFFYEFWISSSSIKFIIIILYYDKIYYIIILCERETENKSFSLSRDCRYAEIGRRGVKIDLNKIRIYIFFSFFLRVVASFSSRFTPFVTLHTRGRSIRML